VQRKVNKLGPWPSPRRQEQQRRHGVSAHFPETICKGAPKKTFLIAGTSITGYGKGKRDREDESVVD
jgi:hypothetical protein